MRGPLANHPASVIRPLLLPDSPVVIWWPGKAPTDQAGDELAQLDHPPAHRCRRREAPAGRAQGPGPGLLPRRHRSELDPADSVAGAAGRRPGPVPGRRSPRRPVEAEKDNPSADLLAAWLQGQLRVTVKRKVSGGPGLTAVRLRHRRAETSPSPGPTACWPPTRCPASRSGGSPSSGGTSTELISEELRRMDADHVYERTVRRCCGKDSNERRDGRRSWFTAGADEVAEALAARLLARLAEIQREFRVPQLALTGGRIATQAYQRLAEEGANSAVDWSRVELWWGDERFGSRPTTTTATPSRRSGCWPRRSGSIPTGCTRCRPRRRRSTWTRPPRPTRPSLGDTVFDICLLGYGPRRPRRVDLPRASLLVRRG